MTPPPNKNEKNEQQFERLRSKAAMDRERLNEDKYLSLFQDVIHKHKDTIKTFFSENSTDINEQTEYYSAESKLLKKAVTMEANSILGGVVVGFTAFLSIRYFPHLAVRALGGDKKVRAVQEAEAKMKRSTNLWMKQLASKTFSLLIEGSLGIWAGYRGYELSAKMQSEDVYEDITKIPLCEGKSFVSETLCDEWITLTNQTIPKSFWNNLNENDAQEQLSDEQTWRYILEFADNCVKRKDYEQMQRKARGLKHTDQVIVPSPGVPHKKVQELTKKEAELLVKSR